MKNALKRKSPNNLCGGYDVRILRSKKEFSAHVCSYLVQSKSYSVQNTYAIKC